MDEDLDIHSQFNSDSDDGSDSTSDSSDEEGIAKLVRDTLTWLMYYRAARSLVHQYIQSLRKRIRRFQNARSGRVFMITALEEDPNIAFCDFRMYPPMFVHFTHILCDKYELQSGQDVDIYEQVGMFLFILAHGKGYRQDCIGTIDGTHVKAVLPASERLHFIGRKGYPSQNVLAASDFNTCFTFVLPGTTGNVHDNRILAMAIPLQILTSRSLPTVNIILWTQDLHIGRDTWRHIKGLTLDIISKNFQPNETTAVVVATMAIHNFLRREGQLDEAFQTIEEVVDAGEIDLPDEEEEIAATNFAPHVRSTE
ncbi:Uncharacterized protein Adt_07937 [Abeliophyllum distichum]|uniref:DUF8040 domain-containing protein n=1 Tax=Abeliophyllum distichum TaxID=126358 RepID=A0ABD1VB60_9LAMI